MSIFMPKFAGDDYSAMQGPCPSGFHVPTKDEWGVLCGILTTTFGLATNATTMGTYFKMPLAGNRYSSSSSVQYVGTEGYYWTSTSRTSTASWCLQFTSSSLSPTQAFYKTTGCCLRCFKDTTTTPDSSWTTLYQGTGNAGIFRNSSLGLISVSGDGTTWYTIQDKNLGATTVYNEGDTLTDTNCGKYYQWGNNYGFPHSGTIARTSNTQVDASSYGPGNYYFSSTFITYSGDWSSVQNNNLRGGVTGVVQNTGEPKKIYIRVNAQPITTSGIYHNSDLGLISLSSDGSNWTTIADKNLGATSTDISSTDSYGYYYQWGNNYGFPTTGTPTTSTTKVDASTYGPGNYYNSNIFIIAGDYYWDTSNNKNLWGGETGTVEAMRGPCDEGYHIPSSTEWDTIIGILVTTFGLPSNSTTVGTYLKLPMAGERSSDSGTVIYSGEDGFYQSSTAYSNRGYNYILRFHSSTLLPQYYWYRASGYPIRPLKNDAVQPDDSRTKLY